MATIVVEFNVHRDVHIKELHVNNDGIFLIIHYKCLKCKRTQYKITKCSY